MVRGCRDDRQFPVDPDGRHSRGKRKSSSVTSTSIPGWSSELGEVDVEPEYIGARISEGGDDLPHRADHLTLPLEHGGCAHIRALETVVVLDAVDRNRRVDAVGHRERVLLVTMKLGNVRGESQLAAEDRVVKRVVVVSHPNDRLLYPDRISSLSGSSTTTWKVVAAAVKPVSIAHSRQVDG